MGALVGRVMWGERLHMAHAKMEDPRVRGHRLVYVSQALGAAVVVLAVLVVEDAVTNAAVGVAMLLMGLTDTEHPPAAGTALGFAIVDFSVELVAVLLVSVVFMVVAQQLVLARLRTLL